MPGTLHADLVNNKLIDDPYLGENEKQLQWVEKANWEYRTRFKIEEQNLKCLRAELEFEGLDTYASVYLNDS